LGPLLSRPESFGEGLSLSEQQSDQAAGLSVNRD
jgi:hypothetical protein